MITLITEKIISWQKRSPFLILILAAVVGAFTGLIGSLFQLSLNFILSWHENFSKYSLEIPYYLKYFL